MRCHNRRSSLVCSFSTMKYVLSILGYTDTRTVHFMFKCCLCIMSPLETIILPVVVAMRTSIVFFLLPVYIYVQRMNPHPQTFPSLDYYISLVSHQSVDLVIDSMHDQTSHRSMQNHRFWINKMIVLDSEVLKLLLYYTSSQCRPW